MGMKIEIFNHTTLFPLESYGYKSPLWGINMDTVLYTWVAMGLLFAGIYFFRKFFFREGSLVYTAVESILTALGDVCSDSVGYFRYDYYRFVTSIFIFTLM